MKIMPKNNKDYWIDREKKKLTKGLKDVKKIEKQLAKEYKKAMDSIAKEVAYMFSKYAKDNKLTYAEANKLLNGKEYKEFRMDLKEYVKLIKETGDEQLLLELKTLSVKSRMSRLDDLFYECDKYINSLYETFENSLQMLFSDTVEDNYYTTIYDIHKSIGVGASFAVIGAKLMQEILSYPWSGKNYSARIWNNRTKLKNVVKEEITQGFIQGKGTREIAKGIQRRMDTDFKNCMRLANTEHAFFANEASFRGYEETHVDEYIYIATLDGRTCSTCGALDGKIFKVKDRAPGINAPVMHPRDRCTTIPHYKDDTLTTRFARDMKGKPIEVPSSMTYEEWKNKFNIE